MKSNLAILLSITILLLISACKKENQQPAGNIDITSCTVGSTTLSSSSLTANIPVSEDFILKFSAAVDSNSVKNNIQLKDDNNALISDIYFRYTDSYKTVIVKLFKDLSLAKNYSLVVLKGIKGSNGEAFTGKEYPFSTTSGTFLLNTITLNTNNFLPPAHVYSVPAKGTTLVIDFSEPIDTAKLKSKFTLSGNSVFDVTLSNSDKTVKLLCATTLKSYNQYDFAISSALRSKTGNKFAGFTNWFTTGLDSTNKFPLISDDDLLTLIQRQTFKYFYDNADPTSGMARERSTSGYTVTSGGSGFGVMALIVGMQRNFITRAEGLTRMTKIVGFLEKADRFHGAWSHWINGSTGKVIPFSDNDNGGDLVETAYMIQGLITMRQYLNPVDPTEKALIDRITALYNGVEWDWYTRGGQNVMYWHWSPSVGWAMNFQLQGYNETLITYVMAASSNTHTIPKLAYTNGFARNGGIKNGKSFYGYTLPLGYDYGGPLFFAHYSFLGLDPRHLFDQYANYWTQNVNHSLINWKYCATNPKKFPNYNAFCWGLTASDMPPPDYYGASEPSNDKGTISPTAAISSLPYTPEQSMNAIRYFYYIVGDRLFGQYGFYDAFDVGDNWWADSYLAIDQGPEIVMIENYRTGLLWDLFMSAPEVKAGLTKLGFSYSKK